MKTKQEQINNLIKRIEDVESTNTRLSKEQRRDVIDNIDRYGRLMKLFDKHKRDINRLNTIVERLDDIQEKEIKQLKAENRQLKTECALLDDELRIARQETINVLNELKEIIPLAMSKQYVCAQIDEMIKELAKK